MGNIYRLAGATPDPVSVSATHVNESQQPGPLWGRSLLWLAFLGPFFFLSYGYCNQLAAAKGVNQSIMFAWEAVIPLVPWTIVPYWSIDLGYGLSFLFCRSRLAVDRHALRLLSAQLISVTCFLLFPLRCGLIRPAIDGPFGFMFDLLMGFDQPYNQAPSLHISLLVVIWLQFAKLSQPWRILVHIWALLIAVSVLTTYQHHFFDVPTGALAGFFCLWLWPETGVSPLRAAWRNTRRYWRLAAYYLAGAGLCGLVALNAGRTAWWLAWPLVALTIVAFNYAGCGAAGFQKHQGRLSLAASVLLAPYLVAAWINSRLWTRRAPQPDPVVDGVWLGRLPRAKTLDQGIFSGVVDLTAELPGPLGTWQYCGHAWLDLVVPEREQLLAAAADIEKLRCRGAVLVVCALGYSRSASAVIAWLLTTGRATTLAQAETLVRKQRPQVVLSPAHRDVLSTLIKALSHE